MASNKIIQEIEKIVQVSDLEEFLTEYVEKELGCELDEQVDEVLGELGSEIRRFPKEYTTFFSMIEPTLRSDGACSNRDFFTSLTALSTYDSELLATIFKRQKQREIDAGEEAHAVVTQWDNYCSLLNRINERDEVTVTPEILERVDSFSFNDLYDIRKILDNQDESGEYTNVWVAGITARKFDAQKIAREILEKDDDYQTYICRFKPHVLEFDPELENISYIFNKYQLTNDTLYELCDLVEGYSEGELSQLINITSHFGNSTALFDLMKKKKEANAIDLDSADEYLEQRLNYSLSDKKIGDEKNKRDNDEKNNNKNLGTFFDYLQELLHLGEDDFFKLTNLGFDAIVNANGGLHDIIVPAYMLYKKGKVSTKDIIDASKTLNGNASLDVILSCLSVVGDITQSIFDHFPLSKPLDMDFLAEKAKGFTAYASECSQWSEIESYIAKTKTVGNLNTSDFQKEYLGEFILPLVDEMQTHEGLRDLLLQTSSTKKVIDYYAIRIDDDGSLEKLQEFIETTKSFYDKLEHSATKEQIIDEYKEWVVRALKLDDDLERDLDKNSKGNSEKGPVHYLDINSKEFQEIYLKYNSPATFAEQKDVARNISFMMDHVEVPITTKQFDILPEIPYRAGAGIVLPEVVDCFESKRDNKEVYHLLSFLYAGMQTFGGFDFDVEVLKKDYACNSLAEYFEQFSNYEAVESLFIATEHARVFSRLTEAYPGLEESVNNFFTRKKERLDEMKFDEPWQRTIAEMEIEHYLGNKNVLYGKQSEGEVIREENNNVMSSIKNLEGLYSLLEDKLDVPELHKHKIDPELLNELLKDRTDVLTVAESAYDSDTWRYEEHGPLGYSIVREIPLPGFPNPAIAKLLASKKGQIALMQEQLELLSPADVYIERRQTTGRVDRRALQAYQRDLKAGRVPNPRIFAKKVVERRDVATLIAVNMNQKISRDHEGGRPPQEVMQQLVSAFGLAARNLDDSIGIFGYSGQTNEKVDIYLFKDFDEEFTRQTLFKIAMLGGRMYNRNGAAYRHFTHRLEQLDADEKFFIDLCHSFEPYDINYEGNTAVQDSSYAIHGMRLQNISPYCVSFSGDGVKDMQTVFDKNFMVTNQGKLFGDITELYKKISGD